MERKTNPNLDNKNRFPPAILIKVERNINAVINVVTSIQKQSRHGKEHSRDHYYSTPLHCLLSTQNHPLREQYNKLENLDNRNLPNKYKLYSHGNGNRNPSKEGTKLEY